MTLLNFSYIFGFNTNLLSKGILYKARSFNKNIIYIREYNNSLILKIIKRDNIYIIN
jgi:hypothetical protein